MTSLSSTEARLLKEFDEKFPSKDPADIGKDDRFHTFLRSSFKEIVRAVKEEVGDMAFVEPAQAGQFAMHSSGYNQAIEEVEEKLQDYLGEV